MALNWSTTSTQHVDAGVKILNHAPPGYGKTALVATLPKPLLLSAEAGTLSLSPKNIARMYGADTPGIEYEIPMLLITSLKDLEDAHKFILNDPHARGFESIALDSFSEIAEICLAAAKKAAKDPRQAYGEMNERMMEIARLFRDLPGKHVYFSAKQEKQKDESTGRMLYAASMPGKQLTANIPHLFDEVFALSISDPDPQGNTFRYLRTKPNIQFSAKDRSGALDEFETPHLGQIIAKIKNKAHV